MKRGSGEYALSEIVQSYPTPSPFFAYAHIPSSLLVTKSTLCLMQIKRIIILFAKIFLTNAFDFTLLLPLNLTPFSIFCLQNNNKRLPSNLPHLEVNISCNIKSTLAFIVQKQSALIPFLEFLFVPVSLCVTSLY